PSFPYRLLWEERQVVSVANLTRADAREFLMLVPQAGVKSEVTRYPLAAANEALAGLREGRLQGAAGVVPELPGPKVAIAGHSGVAAYQLGWSSVVFASAD